MAAAKQSSFGASTKPEKEKSSFNYLMILFVLAIIGLI
jgi:hypothetical protein